MKPEPSNFLDALEKGIQKYRQNERKPNAFEIELSSGRFKRIRGYITLDELCKKIVKLDCIMDDFDNTVIFCKHIVSIAKMKEDEI
jgi:hypothetical protein